MGDYKDYEKLRNREAGSGETNESTGFDGYINNLLIYSPIFFFP